MTQMPPAAGPEMSFLYQVIRDMDLKLDRLIDTFVSVRELKNVELRVSDLENRWRRNVGWVVALIGALSSVAYLVAYLTR